MASDANVDGDTPDRRGGLRRGSPPRCTAHVRASHARSSSDSLPVVRWRSRSMSRTTGFNQSTSGYELSRSWHPRRRASALQIIYDDVLSVDFAACPKKLSLASGKDVFARTVIIATGVRPAKLGVRARMNSSARASLLRDLRRQLLPR